MPLDVDVVAQSEFVVIFDMCVRLVAETVDDGDDELDNGVVVVGEFGDIGAVADVVGLAAIVVEFEQLL